MTRAYVVLRASINFTGWLSVLGGKAARHLVASCMAFLALDAALAQTYQYSDWTPLYVQQRRSPAQLYFLDWDAACREALHPGLEQTYYANPRGGFHPQFGPGVLLRLRRTGRQYPNYFAQGWAIPGKACPSNEWVLVPTLNKCRKPVTYSDSKVCPINNPVDPSDGSKRQSVVDIELNLAGAALSVVRTFFTDSLGKYRSAYGYGWTVDPWARSIQFMPTSVAPQAITVWRTARTFELKNDGAGTWKGTPYNGVESGRRPQLDAHRPI